MRKGIGSETSDRDLVASTLQGDRDAFKTLVERYERKIYALAFEVLRSSEDAQDVLQETFVKTYLALPDFRWDCSFYTWIYRIAYNMSLDYKRKLSRRGGDTMEYTESTADENLFGALEAPHEALLREEARKHLKTALTSLSEEHRTVILLREVEGLSYEEIAQVTGVSKGTIMSRLHYARKRLQDILLQLDPELRRFGPSGHVEELEAKERVERVANGGVLSMRLEAAYEVHK